jgi:hypothetical protein
VDAATTSFERREGGIHVVSVGRRRRGGRVSPVTAARQERRNTSSQGLDECYPAQDQLQPNVTAARLRPDVIRSGPQRSRRHGPGTGLSPRVVENSQDRSGEPQAGRESRRPGGAASDAVPILPLSGLPSSSARIRHRRCPGRAQTALRKHRSLGSERGLATPSPDGKGEITLSPSMKIMPLDPYNTLGRSCEPAYQVDCRGGAARRRHALAGGWSRPAATRRAARSPGWKPHPRSSR